MKYLLVIALLFLVACNESDSPSATAAATIEPSSELLNVKRSDLAGTGIYIKSLKGSDDREIPLREDHLAQLLALETDSKDHIFPISYSRAYAIWYDWTPNHAKSPKSARHTFAVELYKKTRDILLVKTALGHRSIANTLAYAALVDGQEKLREALL